MQRLLATGFAVASLAACSHAPPADFAPDPGLVAQIRDIRVVTTYARACPGAVMPTSYEAILMDGARVLFARSYDKKHPPRLHVVFLDRESPDAVSQEDGDWVMNGNPLATVTTGFRLTATLRAKPSATGTIVVAPDYGCMRHAFVFSGQAGGWISRKQNKAKPGPLRSRRLRPGFLCITAGRTSPLSTFPMGCTV